MNFLTVSSLLAICGLAAAGHLYDNHHGGHATSYAVVTKHEPSKHGWEHKDWEHHNEGHHWDGAKVNHYDDHHYDDHHYDNKHAKYEFDYGVKDLKTGDIKNHWEHRDGDHVKGSYSLKEADGTTRVVEYTADDHNGFNAVVKKIGHAHHPEMVYSKPHYYGGWEADNSHHGYNHGYAHGHATSYVNVKTY